MKIVVFNVRRFFLYLLVLSVTIVVISAISLKGMNVLGVFSDGKEIPIYSVDVSEKLAAITFDCAWGADDIPDILNTLKAADIKATFFVVGQWAEKYPEIIKMIAQDGHDIANHSYSHLRMGSIDRAKMSNEIKQCSDVLEQLTGTKCELFRAPYGDYNNALLLEARKQGCYTIQWDVDSLDWKPGISRSEIMQRINAKIRQGSILLFHNDTPHTAKLLPEIIAGLKTKGYQFVPVSKLIKKDQYYIDEEGRQKNNT
ncbi:MAG: polysaccharide deacetylase family protein [Clostridiaceae bacterium]